MEKIKTSKIIENVKYDDTNIPGCSFWFLADDEDADKDLSKLFTIEE